jgi:hypothetical protein
MPESGAAGEGRPQDPSGQGEPRSAGAEGPGRPEHPDGRDGRPGPEQREGLPDRGQGAPDLWAELIRVAEQAAAGRPLDAVVPAWRRRTRGEQRWPITASVVVAIVLQMLLSNSLNKPLPHLLLPLLEIALGVFLSIANPVRVERRGPVVRAASISLILLISAANAVSAVLLIRAIIEALPDTASALPLLASGASIWATNVIAFGLWYWEFDRGGPIHRADGVRQHPDLMFPQMASPRLAPPDWEPHFLDYLYLSFTNATAFSPTDVMPLARWAKVTMAVQSAVALAVGALVIARAVNILR